MELKSFTVEGIGTFQFIVELPHTVFFMDARKKMANVLGGIKNFLTLEALRDEGLKIEGNSYVPREDVDDLQCKVSYSALAELHRAMNMCLMQDHIAIYPTGKKLEQLSPEEYAIVEQEFLKQLEFFRSPKPEAAGTTSPSNESPK